MIEHRHDPDQDLIVYTMIGEFDAEEFAEAGRAMYEMQPPPRLSIWDLSNAKFGSVSYETVRALQAQLVGTVRGREGGKTAVVAPQDIGFATARQYAALAESFDLPFEHQVFRTVDDAAAWLGVRVEWAS